MKQRIKDIVYDIATILLIIAVAAVVVLGIIGIIFLLWSFCSAILSKGDYEPKQKVITVNSKSAEDYGVYCYRFILTNCNKKTEYFVNGKKVDKDFYKSVSEGGTYTCKVSNIYPDYLYDCRPKVQGGDNNND